MENNVSAAWCVYCRKRVAPDAAQCPNCEKPLSERSRVVRCPLCGKYTMQSDPVCRHCHGQGLSPESAEAGGTAAAAQPEVARPRPAPDAGAAEPPAAQPKPTKQKRVPTAEEKRRVRRIILFACVALVVFGISALFFRVGRSRGYALGKEDGYADGYRSGYDAGYEAGKLVGLGKDRQQVYDAGYEDGFAAGNYGFGYDTGHDDGFAEGSISGYAEGYDAGYTAGRRTAN